MLAFFSICQDFVNQRYLVFEESQNTQDNVDKVYEVKWGFRAKKEISKRKILEHVCQVGINFKAQYIV